MQHLPPRQRAVLIARDVLDWSAQDSADLLDTSVASVNSALQRARATLRERLPERRQDWTHGNVPTAEEAEVLGRFIDASERGDMSTLRTLLRDDAVFSMPPEPGWVTGGDSIVAAWAPCMVNASHGQRLLVPTSANRQPAVAVYVLEPRDMAYRPQALEVLRIEDGQIAEVTAFFVDDFAAYGLPARR